MYTHATSWSDSHLRRGAHCLFSIPVIATKKLLQYYNQFCGCGVFVCRLAAAVDISLLSELRVLAGAGARSDPARHCQVSPLSPAYRMLLTTRY